MSALASNKKSQELAHLISRVADNLWGPFKHTDFARIIIPFMLLRRMECVLADTKEEVVSFYEAEGENLDMDLTLPSIAGQRFYNTSRYTLATLGSTNTRANLEQYISSFSDNVKVVFQEFSFFSTMEELEKAGLLVKVVQEFANLPMHPDELPNRAISDAYEQLIRDYAASINEKAGEFMTPKDIVRLVTKLVLATEEEVFSEKGVVRTVYDPACGLLGFITDAMELIHEMNPDAKIVAYGQELDPRTHAMALTSMLIKGGDGKNITQGSTLSDDKLSDRRFHYGLANPPFGIKWERDRAAVEKEHKELGYQGRFGPGLPRVSDGSMLFLMHLVARMENPENGGGRVGIVLSGSPLFTGDAGSGESEIRRWLLEQDYVDAIIALPTDMFFNTGIGTYVWILSNKKEEHRRGKVQLINLADVWTPMRKSQGTKRRYLTDEQIDDVVRVYDDFRETDICKIFNTTDFAYRKVAIKRQLRGKLIVTPDTLRLVREGKQFGKLAPEQQEAWLSYLDHHQGVHEYAWLDDVAHEVRKNAEFGKVGKPLIREIRTALFVTDPEGEPILDDKGVAVPDPDFSDTEIVPLGQDVDGYLKKEVLPYVPDAFIDHSVRDHKDGQTGKVGYEINFNRYFYNYESPRSLDEIDEDIRRTQKIVATLLQELGI